MKKYFLVLFIIVFKSFSQAPVNKIETNLSPNGVLENVFDHYGNKYKLSDLVIGKEVRDENSQILRATNPLPMTCGYYNLYFEDGCGMENTSNPTHMARRAVVCQVFTDLSVFIKTPLTTNGLNNKVNIWVRNINNVIVAPNSSTGVLGLASSFYSMPYNTAATFGGIVDNEIWKTIHTGVDSYTNVVSPLASSENSGIFYHGMMAFNFTDTISPINWNTDLSITSFPNLYDLYSVVLHEITHSLGFSSLISSTGASKFNSGYNYYNRYDRFLKNNSNTQFLLTSSGCGTGSAGSMYNYVFNSSLNSSVLQPNVAGCSNSIRYVGASDVKVYTPTVFEPSNSLSHFDGTCIIPNASFALSYSMGTNEVRRFLKPQERNVLGDIGYSLKSIYGVSSTYQGTTVYSGGDLSGVLVAGVNDGINTDGTFKYTGNAGSSIVINSSTDTTKRILNNDTSASTNFECLQDITDPAATFNFASGASTTQITFSSSIPGLHLLRYVPRNSTGTQKGNITYIYVYVESTNNLGVPKACDLIVNGDFEQHATINYSGWDDQIHLAYNWSKGNIGTTDYFNSDGLTPQGRVPCNDVGYQSDKISLNKGYAGFVFTSIPDSGDVGIETLKTKLTTPLLANKNYQLSFDVSLAEGCSSRKLKLQAYFSNQFTTYTNSINGIPISNLNMLFTDNSYSDKVNGWQTVVFNFATGSDAGQSVLYLGALDDISLIPNTFSPQGIGGCSYSNRNIPELDAAYYFIDNVSLIPLNGGSFSLPSTLCQQQILSNLNIYLDGLPTNGVFSGTGVVNNGGIYSLNSTSMPFGVNTISYTYTNSSGCSVKIYSNIIIEDCGCNCLATEYFTATTAGLGMINFTILNSNPACVVGGKHSWSFGDGTSALTMSPTISHTYTSLGTFNVGLISKLYGAYDQLLCTSSKKSLPVTIIGGKTGKTIEEDNIGDKSVLIYPNPASLTTNIKLELNNNENVTFAFRTIDGKEVLRKEMFLSKGTQIVEIDIPSTINDGIILVEVSYNNYKIVKKLNIKK